MSHIFSKNFLKFSVEEVFLKAVYYKIRYKFFMTLTFCTPPPRFLWSILNKIRIKQETRNNLQNFYVSYLQHLFISLSRIMKLSGLQMKEEEK